jgi:hypothetical protein
VSITQAIHSFYSLPYMASRYINYPAHAYQHKIILLHNLPAAISSLRISQSVLKCGWIKLVTSNLGSLIMVPTLFSIPAMGASARGSQ